MLSHLLAFAAGAALIWFLLRVQNRPAPSPGPLPAIDSSGDPMRAADADLDASIIEYVADNQVFHINDICRAIEHPKGARFVRAHVHLLLEQGKIRYRNMLYTV